MTDIVDTVASDVETVVAAVLPALEALAPLVADSTAVGKVITALEGIMPIVQIAAQDLVQPVKNIIAALQNTGTVTQDQITSLQTLDAQADAAFDAALAAYNQANPDSATAAAPAAPGTDTSTSGT